MKIQNFIKNNLLFKVASANTSLVVTRMFFSLISQKVLAIYIGAEGIALVGNFKNVIGFFGQFSVFGTFNGIVKYISEFKENKKELNHISSTVLFFTLISSILSFIVLFFCSNLLNEYIFGLKNNFAFIFKILAFMIPFMGINMLLNGLLNGLSEYKAYVKVMIGTTVTSTLFIVLFTIQNNVRGSLLAISITPLIQFFMFAIFCFKPYIKDLLTVKFSFSSIYRNKLLSYSLMTLVVILLINLVDILVRNLIEDTINVNAAGYWTAMTSISRIYMQFTLALFPLYILPKYSKITSTSEFRKEVLLIYKVLLPFFLLGLLFIFLFKNTIISVLYTDDFLTVSSLFKWQLLGDLMKLCALIISYQFLAKKQITYFIITEVLSVVLFYVFAKYFISNYGIEGVVLAHFVRYVIYFLVVVYLLRHKLTGKDKVL